MRYFEISNTNKTKKENKMTTQKGILKAAHKQAKQAKYFNGGDYIAYLAFYMRKSNWNISLIEEMSQELEDYRLRIPFNSRTARKHVKEMGAKWNATAKVWEVTCAKIDLDYLIEYSTENEKTKSNVGNYGAGCISTKYAAQTRGYDAIED